MSYFALGGFCILPGLSACALYPQQRICEKYVNNVKMS